jgi:enoyl-CoA hydratase/carnithine racemase
MTAFASGALVLSFDEHVATLTLNRPERGNAIGAAMWAAMPDLVDAVARQRDALVLVIRGAAGNFAAGADISEFDTVFADRAATLRYADAMVAATNALARLAKPTIALIEGHCIGAGVALALACDLRIAASDAAFAITPARLGLVYTLADTRRLAATIGNAAAKDLLFTGRRIGAAEALALRLVGSVVEPTALAAAVQAKAQGIASASQWSVRRAKAMLECIEAGHPDETDETRGWFADAPEGEDFREGLAAFRDKRPPRFPWR